MNNCLTYFKIHRKLYIAIAILIVTFLFSRLPFFIWMPLPGIEFDTFTYYLMVEKMQNGNFYGFNMLPPGFIIFLFITGILCNTLISIIIIQNIISFLMCILLITVIYKFYNKILLFVTVILSIYMMDSYILREDFTILTESLYRNSLIFIVVLFIWALNTKNKFVWITLSISLIFPPSFRCNGMYIYFIIVLLIIFMIVNQYEKKYYFFLIIPFFALNLIWSTFNYKSEGYFLPGNPVYIPVLSKAIMPPADNLKNIRHDRPSYLAGKFNLFFYLTTYAAERKPSFYYTHIKDVYNSYFIKNIPKDTSLICYEWNDSIYYAAVPVSMSLRKLVFKDYYNIEKNERYKKNIIYFNPSYISNIWLYSYHLFYKFYCIFFNNLIWLFAYFSLLIYSVIRLIKDKLRNKEAFIFFTVAMIHFLSLLLLTFVTGYQARYIQVSEFIIYLTVVLLPFILKDFYKHKIFNVKQ